MDFIQGRKILAYPSFLGKILIVRTHYIPDTYY